MMSLLFLALLAQQQPSILRVEYLIQWSEDSRQVSAKLYLNRLADDHFALVCRKTTTGIFFKYWATPDRNVLYFPRDSVAFEGQSDSAFRLFPGGPRMTRGDWLKLLSNPHEMRDVSGVQVSIDEEWTRLSLTQHQFQLSWRERKRTIKNSYPQHLFEPRMRNETDRRHVTELDELWKPQ